VDFRLREKKKKKVPSLIVHDRSKERASGDKASVTPGERGGSVITKEKSLYLFPKGSCRTRREISRRKRGVRYYCEM